MDLFSDDGDDQYDQKGATDDEYPLQLFHDRTDDDDTLVGEFDEDADDGWL